jgi:hypothetical protein
MNWKLCQGYDFNGGVVESNGEQNNIILVIEHLMYVFWKWTKTLGS